jgi:enamine deaminase RidA (YjgF/YER057c/UK114 family)
MLTVGQCRESPFAEATVHRKFVMVTQRRNVSSGSEFEAAVGYSRAVRTGPCVAVSGTTAAGETIGDQTREVLRRIEIALTEVGASMSDVVRIRMFVTDISRWREVGAVHAEVFGDVRPAATMVEVSALIAPELMVEIEADAYVSGENRPSDLGR